MDNHVSGPSFGPRLTNLGEEFASLRPARKVETTSK
jgi:hypothetical protein